MRTVRILAILLGGASTAAAQPAPSDSTPPAVPVSSTPPPAVPVSSTPPPAVPVSSTPPPAVPVSSTPPPSPQLPTTAAVTVTARDGGGPEWTVAVAPRFGVTVPTSKLGPMVVGGVELDIALPVANHQLVLAFDAALTRPGHDGSVMDARIPDGMATYSIHQLEMVAGVMVSYRLFASGHRVVPWFGAGPILHLLETTETTSLAPGDNSATATKLGGQIAGGVDYRVGPGFLVGDLRLVYSQLDNLLTGSVNAGNLALAAGYRFLF